MKHYQINWNGRQIALKFANDPREAMLSLIAEPGYGYYTTEQLEAVEIPMPKITDAFGNTRTIQM